MTLDIFCKLSFIHHFRSGYGEWEDPSTKTRCRILSRKPQELASDIYEWAVSHGYLNSVCTVYELHSGDDVVDTTFCGLDPVMIQRALSILEEQGKCVLFQGNSSEESGVKFLER
jgi:ESCRT-II complex subunit VPS25